MENLEEREKRTDKVKKRTYGGFYAEFKKWNTRGKSSKDLKLMIEDLKNCVTHQLVRIKKHKYVIDLYKKNDVSNKLLQQKLKTSNEVHEKNLLSDKLKRRDVKIEYLNQDVSELEESIKSQAKEIEKLSKELDKKDSIIAEVRTRNKVGYTKKVVIPLSPKAKLVEKIAKKGVDEKVINNLEYITRTNKFLKDRKLTLDNLDLIVKAELLGNIKSKEVGVSYKTLNTLTDLGYFNSSFGLKGASKYWYVSVKGKELLKDYRNYLSYAKSILI